MNGTGHGQRFLAIERLELRAMLAGNVRASSDGGNLFLRGDDEDNAVVISRVGNNQYLVVGVDDRDGNPTSINGVENGSQTFSNVKKDVDIKLRGGDDLLGIGNDETALQELLDELNGGAEFVPDSPELTRIRRHLEIEMGSGDDAVGLFVDVGRNAEIDLGSGADALAMESSLVGDDMFLYGRNGDDSLRVRDSSIKDFLKVQLGGNGGALSIDNVRARHAEIRGSNSADDVEIIDLVVKDQLRVFLEGGNDSLALGGSRGKKAILRGNSGSDTFDNLGDNSFRRTDRTGFETVQTG
jgi:hypothetical protein